MANQSLIPVGPEIAMLRGWKRAPMRFAAATGVSLGIGVFAAALDWLMPAAGEFRILPGMTLLYLLFLVRGQWSALPAALCLGAGWTLAGETPLLTLLPVAAVLYAGALHRWSGHFAHVAASFWFLLAGPAVGCVTLLVLRAPTAVATYAALNIALNGVACAVLAVLAERMVPRARRRPDSFSMEQAVRTYLLPLTIIPVLALIALDAAQSRGRYAAEAERTTQLMASRAANVVGAWWDGMRVALRQAGQFGLEEYLGYRGLPRPGLALLGAQSDALAQWQFSEVVLVVASGTVIDRWPMADGGAMSDVDREGWPAGPFSEPVVLAMPAGRQPIRSLSVFVPIANGGEHLGFVAGSTSPAAIHDLLRGAAGEDGTAIEVRAGSRQLVAPFGETTMPGSDDARGPAVGRRPWVAHSIVAEATIAPALPWTLRLSHMPRALHAEALQQGLRALVAGTIICLLGGIAAFLLGRGLARSLIEVATSVSRSMTGPRTAAAPMHITELDQMSRQFIEAGDALRAQTQDALERQQHAERLVRRAPVVIFTLRLGPGLKWSLASHNQVAEALFGYGRGTIRDREDWEAIIDPETQPTEAQLNALVATGTLSTERRIVCADGSRRWVYEQLALVAGTAGDAMEAIGVWLDMHERRETELRLLQSSKLVTLGEMATGMAHELNQPLGAISLAAENLQHRLSRTELPAEARDYLRARAERIASQAQRAARIIDHMRIFGRTPSASAEAFDVRDVIAGTLVICQHGLHATGIEIRQDVDPHLPEVFGYPQLLEQAVLNIVLNARDAIAARMAAADEADGPPARHWVEIAAHAVDGNALEIRIADSGGGIDRTALARLFEPFFTTKPTGQGMGLGLSITFGIVRDMGGTIAATNGDDGAVFTIVLPRHVAAARERNVA